MIEQPSSSGLATLGKPPSTSFFPWLGGICSVIGLWLARSQQRRHLAQLDDTALQDIGLTRQDVQRETAKPFWQK